MRRCAFSLKERWCKQTAAASRAPADDELEHVPRLIQLGSHGSMQHIIVDDADGARGARARQLIAELHVVHVVLAHVVAQHVLAPGHDGGRPELYGRVLREVQKHQPARAVVAALRVDADARVADAVLVVALAEALLDPALCVRGVVEVDVIVLPQDGLQRAVDRRVIEERHELGELRQQVVAGVTPLLLQLSDLLADHLVVRDRSLVAPARNVSGEVWVQHYVAILDELHHRAVVELRWARCGRAPILSRRRKR